MLAFRFLLLTLAASGLIASTSAGADGHEQMRPEYAPVMRHYTSEQGLPLSGVTSILQATDGYLWVSTYAGLARFDGQHFTRFGLAASGAQPDGPPSNRILVLREDATGRIWIGTQDAGLAIMTHDQRFLPVDACHQDCQVNAIVPGEDGMMWVGTDSGLLRVDPKTLEVSAATHQPNNVTVIVLDSQGRLFVVADHRIGQFDAGRIRYLPTPEHVHDIVDLQAWKEDRLLLASGTDLFDFAPGQQDMQPWNIGPIESLGRTADGRQYAMLRNGALLQLHPDRSHTTVLEPSETSPSRLEADTEGNLWVGTHNHGLIRLRVPWIGLLNQASLDLAVPGRAIAPDGSGGLWLATNCRGLRRWHADGRLESWRGSIRERTECMETLFTAPNRTLWIGGSGGDLMRVRAGESQPSLLEHWPGLQPVRALYLAAPDTLLAAVRRSTYRLRLDANDDILDATPIPAMEGLTVRQITPARSGGLWFAGDHGLVRLENDRIVEHWGPEQGLSSRFVRSVHEDDGGNLWVGTYGGGLNLIAGGKVSVFSPANGLTEDAVSCILQDAGGRLWLGGNHGATLLLKHAPEAPLESRLFDANDGLNPAEINGGNQSACIVDAAGRLWFSLVRGFAVLDPARYRPPPSPSPRTYVEQAILDGQPHRVDAPLHLKASAHNVEIGYTAIDMTTPERLRFRFRLSGINDDWIEAGSNRSVVYPAIPWGEHLFEVQARVEGSSWPTTSAQLRIIRPAPWYQSPWIWLLSTLAALLLLLDATWQRPPPEENG